MKKIMTLLLFFNFLAAFSQDFVSKDISSIPMELSHEYVTNTYHALGLSDGNFVFTQSYTVFLNEEDTKDVGIMFIKMSPKAEIVDTLFYVFDDKNSIDYPNSRLIRNPYNEDESIYNYFSYGDTCYYHAVFFDNDLNVTNVVRKPFMENGFGKYYIPYFNMDNNFMYVWKTSVSEYWAVESDIYGNIQKRSSKLTIDSDIDGETNCFSFFVYDEDKREYGFAIDGHNATKRYIILDEDLNIAYEKTLVGYDGYQRWEGLYTNVANLDDGNFAILGSFYNNNDYSDRQFRLCKVDKDFNIIDENILRFLKPYSNDHLSVEPESRNLIRCKDGGLYCIWGEKYTNGLSEISVFVARVDKDLNLIWERKVATHDVYGLFMGADVLDNGNLVLAGNNIETEGGWGFVSLGSSIVVFQNDGLSIGDNNYDIRPYSLYPNPARDEINIRMSPDVSCERVDVYSLDGRLCHTQNFNMQTIDVSELTNGVYVMQIIMDNGDVYTDKVIVEF